MTENLILLHLLGLIPTRADYLRQREEDDHDQS
jgi:hypothetical protein